ncbi:Importin-5 [Chlorella vulgaris]
MAASAGVDALVAGDAAAFEQLCAMLMSSENEQRSQAEAAFEELKKHPDACAQQLVRALRQSPSLETRGLCAVLLRKVLTRDESSIWPRMSAPAKAAVKAEMLGCIQGEEQRAVTKKVCDCVSELAAGIIEDQGWPELLPFMFQLVQSGQPRLVESALLIFAAMARYVMGVLVQYMGTLNGVLQQCLGSNEADVRLAAMKATCVFISELESAEDRDKFQATLPALLSCIGRALNEGDDSSAQDAIEMFIEIAEAHPRFLRRQLPAVIAESESLDEGVRMLAAEFLVTLCEAREKAPGMMRKLPQFGDRLFKCLVLFLLDVEDDPEWHSAEDEKHEHEGEGDLFDFGQECLDRAALSLGANTVAASAGALLPVLLADGDWKRRHAALITIAQIAEGCCKVFVKQMEGLVTLCLQDSQHATLLPPLILLMDDFNNPRVQAHACAAVVNFAEASDQDTLAPYLDTLISKLLALLQRGRRRVQEAALTAIAALADTAEEYFIKYYDSCMPIMTSILTHASGKEMHLLRAKALECVSLVGLAVGKERFGEDAKGVMQYMQQVQAAGLEADDPLASYMLQAGARICKALGQDFLPYLQLVMPPLLAAAQLKPDVNVIDLEDTDGEEEDDEDIETFVVGGKRVSLHTSVLEEKATACNMICCYADELKEGFYPYVEQVTQLMVPLLKFYFNEEVRASAAQALPEMLRSASLAAAKGLGPDAAYVRTMLGFVWEPLVEAIPKEPDMEILVNLLEAVDEIIDIVDGPKMLTLEQIAAAFSQFAGVVSEYEERREGRLDRMKSEDFDAEEQEAIMLEHESETELLDALGSCITTTLRLFGDGALPLVEALMPAVSKLLEKGRFPEERRVAICIMDDVLEHSPAGGEKYAAQVLPILLQGCGDRDANVRQCSVYGLGCAAQHRSQGFQPHAAAAVQAVLGLITAPDARSADNELCFDNAVSALGKLLEFQPAAIDAQAGGLFVSQLPLKGDTVEARVVHKQLVGFIQRSDPRILGDSNANLPKIVEVFAKVLAKGDKLVDADVSPQMATLLKQMQAHLPPGVFAGCVAALKPKQQQRLQDILPRTERSGTAWQPAHHKRAVIAPAAAAMVAPSAGPAPHATQPEDSTDVSLTKLPDDVMDQAMMFCSMYHSQLAGGYWTVGKGTATCPHPGGVHTPDDVKKAHWVLGLHRVVQNSSLRAFYSGSAKAPGFLVDRCAGADAWLSGDYKKHCDEHGAANQTAIPLKWTKSKTQFNTEKCANGWREVAERKAANKLEHDAAVAARWSAMQPSQKRQRVDGAKAVEEGDTEFCSCIFTMYKRDFGILLLSVLALYLSLQHEGAYQFRKAWYHSFEEHGVGAHDLEDQPHPVPPPIVADLNGDGKPEVIVATPAGHIQLVAPRRFGDGFAKAQLLSQADLNAASSGGGVRIAAMAAGYLMPPPKELVRAPRKQVIVLVTTQLRVICLNHNLQQEWEHDLSAHYPQHGAIWELAIHVSDQRVDKSSRGIPAGEGDKGLVVVGASVLPLTVAQRAELEAEVEEEVREELLASYRAKGRRGGASDEEKEELQREGRHFSYFAFEGSTGDMRWMHEAKDFHRNLGELADALVAQHSYHMSAEESEARHYGESSCRDYRSWHSPLDTALVPAHFEKHKAGAGAQKQQLAKMGALSSKQAGNRGAAGQHGGGVAAGGGRGKGPPVSGGGTVMGGIVSSVVKGATLGEGPAAARRHKELPPNVVVAHLEEGIEAIHLFSGRTVCRLHLPSPGLHVDLNGDGVPEHIVAVGGNPQDLVDEGEGLVGHARQRFCYMSVHAGIPARLHLFNGTICRAFGRKLRRGVRLQAIEVAPPIFLPQPGKHGNYRGGLAQKGLAVILNSQGELSAYDPAGDLLWQHYVGASWRLSQDEDLPDGVPTLKALPLRPGAVPSAILAAGADAATVVSEQGKEVDSWELPDPPVMPLQLADWNFDGYTDVLLVSGDGVWAWAQVRHPGALPFSALVAALMVIMAAVFGARYLFVSLLMPAGSLRERLRLRKGQQEPSGVADADQQAPSRGSLFRQLSGPASPNPAKPWAPMAAAMRFGRTSPAQGPASEGNTTDAAVKDSYDTSEDKAGDDPNAAAAARGGLGGLISGMRRQRQPTAAVPPPAGEGQGEAAGAGDDAVTVTSAAHAGPAASSQPAANSGGGKAAMGCAACMPLRRRQTASPPRSALSEQQPVDPPLLDSLVSYGAAPAVASIVDPPAAAAAADADRYAPRYVQAPPGSDPYAFSPLGGHAAALHNFLPQLSGGAAAPPLATPPLPPLAAVPPPLAAAADRRRSFELDPDRVTLPAQLSAAVVPQPAVPEVTSYIAGPTRPSCGPPAGTESLLAYQRPTHPMPYHMRQYSEGGTADPPPVGQRVAGPLAAAAAAAVPAAQQQEQGDGLRRDSGNVIVTARSTGSDAGALMDDPIYSYIHSNMPRQQGGTTAAGGRRRTRLSRALGSSNWEVEFKDITMLKPIGEGAFGRVFLARWHQIIVACKVLIDRDAVHREARGEAEEEGGALTLPAELEAKLEEEAALMAMLRHPNVVSFYGVCRTPPCLLTEYCSRGSLHDVLSSTHRVPRLAEQLCWQRCLSMALDGALGMLYLHSLKPPLVHRDLKTPNLLVSDSWQAKVCDFNLSRIMEESATTNSLIDINPRWLSPEMIRGERATVASDVFAFAVVMWELLTWRMAGLLVSGARLTVPPTDELPPRGIGGAPAPVVSEYVALMRRCWAEDPAARPSFDQISTELRQACWLAGCLLCAIFDASLQQICTHTRVIALSTVRRIAPNSEACALLATPSERRCKCVAAEVALAVLTTPGLPQACILGHLTLADRLSLRATCTSTAKHHAELARFPALDVEMRVSQGKAVAVVAWEAKQRQAYIQTEAAEGRPGGDARDAPASLLEDSLTGRAALAAALAANQAALPGLTATFPLTARTRLPATRGSEPACNKREAREGHSAEEALGQAAPPTALVVALATSGAGLPAAVSTLTALTKLEILRGSEPDSGSDGRLTLNLLHLAPLARLRQLSVSGAALSGGGEAALAPLTLAAEGGNAESQVQPLLLPRLQALRLADCGLRRLPPQLAGSFSSLSLSQNRKLVALAPPSALPCFVHSLQRLELDGCCLTALPEQLSALTALTHLDLSRNSKLCGGWQHLLPLTQLRMLNLRSCDLEEVPEQLSALTALNRLNLSRNPQLGWAQDGGTCCPSAASDSCTCAPRPCRAARHCEAFAFYKLSVFRGGAAVHGSWAGAVRQKKRGKLAWSRPPTRQHILKVQVAQLGERQQLCQRQHVLPAAL